MVVAGGLRPDSADVMAARRRRPWRWGEVAAPSARPMWHPGRWWSGGKDGWWCWRPALQCGWPTSRVWAEVAEWAGGGGWAGGFCVRGWGRVAVPAAYGPTEVVAQPAAMVEANIAVRPVRVGGRVAVSAVQVAGHESGGGGA
jgi:hypothetical protein